MMRALLNGAERVIAAKKELTKIDTGSVQMPHVKYIFRVKPDDGKRRIKYLSIAVREFNMQSIEFKYASLWSRTVATAIDIFLILTLIFSLPFLIFACGWDEYLYLAVDNASPFILGLADFLTFLGLPFIVTMLFGVCKQATPGRMAVSIKILDVKTGLPASTAKLALRYFAIIVAALPLLLGLFWIAFDKKKQGLHDKIAGTVVVKCY